MKQGQEAEGVEAVVVQSAGAQLDGDLLIPGNAAGLVLFAHGSGSSRKSPRNRYVSGVLNSNGLATLLIDLLTPEEESVDVYTRHFRFDINLLSDRLTGVVDWLTAYGGTGRLPIGLFGASTGAAAALVTAARRPDRVDAVVSRGGRPDLADAALGRVRAPALLIVGGLDTMVVELNRQAYDMLHSEKKLEVVPGATHLFEEPGTLEEVARLAADWFKPRLVASPSPAGKQE